jgi:hypothetical protein
MSTEQCANCFFTIPASTEKRYMFANTDIEVSDDLEIYFVPSEYTTNFIDDIEHLSKEQKLKIYEAVFQRVSVKDIFMIIMVIFPVEQIIQNFIHI